MRLGISPIQGSQTYDQLLEQAKYADGHGIDSLFLQEHHETTPMSWPDPLTVLAGVATVTRRLQLGTAVLLLPLYHPVRVAESGAILDGLSDGRFVLGAGLGYRTREFELMNVDRRARASIYEEYLTIVSRAWSEEAVTFDGEHYHLDAFACSPRPTSRPRPDIWLGGYHPNALERAARFVARGLGDAWFPGTQLDVDGVADRMATFDERMSEHDVDPDAVHRPILRDGLIAESTAAAEELAREYLWPTYRDQYASGGTSSPSAPGAEPVGSSADPIQPIRERAIVGSPGDWIDQLRTYEQVTGVDEVVVRLFFPGMSHDQVMRQLEVLCDEVLPAL